ncbi:MAG: sugar ABC transporter ATP-binding protein [Oscillospiraceae bacterium]|nr:sugar ABC transporter ATP-binding protein [Oscillospiraceae bacterium]
MERAAEHEIIMECRKITKTFGPVVALDQVDLTVRRGEVRGLIGENGSGKSTVTSIFSGMQPADSGEMTYKGQPWKPSSMQWAATQGVGMIVQETGTVPEITVAENMFLCQADRFASFGGKSGKRWGFINGRAMVRAAQEALDDIGASHIRASAVTNTLDMQDRKLVEVAKVWMQNPEIIVVDETTTALSQTGRDIIYDLMDRMRKSNRSVVFISHDLDEIKERCDTLTVLRDGHIIRTFEKEEYEDDAIRTAMIGREMEGDYYRSDWDGSCGEKVVLEIKDANLGDQMVEFSLQAHEGEILGIGGLSHCGMHTVGKVLFGDIRPASGSVLVYSQKEEGEEVVNPAFAMKRGIGYVAKDRDVESLNTQTSIRDNIAIAGLDRIAINDFLILFGREKAYVEEQREQMQIKCFSIDQEVSQLSGGNKQKVVFGKWIGCGSRILILDCPTRGIDVGVKQAMYQMMYHMKREGKTIVMISEEMTELMGMSDRLIIMKDGRITKEFQRSPDLSDHEIIKYMI